MAITLAGCSFTEPEIPETIANFEVKEVVKSGRFEERVEYETIPINNCDNRSSIEYSVERQRTLEQSVSTEITVGGAVSGEAGIGIKAT